MLKNSVFSLSVVLEQKVLLIVMFFVISYAFL